MPTPSQTPDQPSSRSHSAATCPDLEETVQSVSGIASHTPLQSSTSWRSHQLQTHTLNTSAAVGGEVDVDEPMSPPSRVATASPLPSSLELALLHRLTPPEELTSEQGCVEDSRVEDRHEVTTDVRRVMGQPSTEDGSPSVRTAEPAMGGSGRPRRTSQRENLAGLVSRHPTSIVRLPLAGDLEDENRDALTGSQMWERDSGLRVLGFDVPYARHIPLVASSYLRPGCKFTGTQQSARQRYEVQVELKHVDLRESFLCGYLRIQGLTDDHPTLTTYFEGEIIGNKYGFFTQHPDWGATEAVDLAHWKHFVPWKPLSSLVKKGISKPIKDVSQREHVFMRWKEHFLVPDHRVKTINGASFEGFYYICFNQLRGEISGIYFHSKSERFQQLELKYVEERGCYGSMELR